MIRRLNLSQRTVPHTAVAEQHVPKFLTQGLIQVSEVYLVLSGFCIRSSLFWVWNIVHPGGTRFGATPSRGPAVLRGGFRKRHHLCRVGQSVAQDHLFRENFSRFETGEPWKGSSP